MFAALAGPVLVAKGPVDIITTSKGEQVVCTAPASLKRSGGQGDVLAGRTHFHRNTPCDNTQYVVVEQQQQVFF
jgi:Carbohydrate kinase